MLKSDFNYDLPEELIAQAPLARRNASRLLSLRSGQSIPEDKMFTDLPELFRQGDLLVMNDTRVIPARLFGKKETGGKVEILLERLLDDKRCLAQIRASKSPASGKRIVVQGGYQLEVINRHDDLFELQLISDVPLLEMLEQVGHIPLPPYIKRDDEQSDKNRYQTVYADQPGAVAAPTAGLHFDQPMLDQLEKMGVRQANVTLHVGAGTFQPVRVDRIEEHVLHAEWVEVNSATVQAIKETREQGGRVVAVGTTSVRSLESAAQSGEIAPFQGDTRLFIYPGYQFRVVDALLTNFHLPESSLLMLVCAFGGYERVMSAYHHAVQSGYRFFSYGDAMWLEP
ncbi:MAG: tRNA preQ1(34) S-adenosylmethionine ribosyltransferase-isomerase QueA [Gammaproteobacteria bacterium]|nr:MAG: tRNA preQ1(34) S-adenosylmethionine ribosyltransferase-isomerase QueA [Gammaproteobacteria bacterium]